MVVDRSVCARATSNELSGRLCSMVVHWELYLCNINKLHIPEGIFYGYLNQYDRENNLKKIICAKRMVKRAYLFKIVFH